ncbi:MAG: Gfo/Idh/MocA family oxidoreductase [Bacteroidales bacterium]|nr:Gfo/Idh/MocA family oxidoreductase [Bacteroidales bacterium]
MNRNISETGRREFLKTFSLMAGGTALLSTFPSIAKLYGASAGKSPSQPVVKLGLIGTGSRGQYLMQLLQNVPDAEIVAVCDDFQPHLDQAVALTGGKASPYSDYRRLLERKDVEGVIIAVPLYLHAMIAIDALKAGKHVFSEKSMAKTTEECASMLKVHYQTGKILQIGHQRVFDIRFVRGVQWIRDGHIGPVTQIRAWWHRNNDWRREVIPPSTERKTNWRLYREYSCGLMTELASHHLQVANWVLDAHPVSVTGTGSINYWKDGREVFDNVAVIYSYPNGVQFIYDSVISNKKYGLEVQVMGPQGTVEMEAGKYYLENPPAAPGIVQLINSLEKDLFEVVPVGGPSWVPENPSEDKGDYFINKILRSDGSDMQLVAFAEAVRQNKVIPGLAEQGYLAGVSTLLGDEATLTGKTIYWPSELEIEAIKKSVEI